MKFTVALHLASEGGFTAQCLELPGAIGEGETRTEALDDVADAISLILQTRHEKARDPTTPLDTVDIHVVF